MKRLFVVLFVGLILAPQALGQGNLLVDPSFEGEQYNLVSIDPVDSTTFSVPNGWNGGVIRQPRTESWMNVHATGFPHTGHIRWSGGRSFHMQRGGGTFTAFVYQQVSVAPGTEVQGGARAFIEAPPHAGSVVRAGIDPDGGTNPFNPSVVWSAWNGVADNWNSPVVTARVGAGGVATLFLFATQSVPTDPNGVYWDEAFLNGAAGAGLPNGQPAQQSGGRYVTSNIRVNVRDGAGLNFNRIGLMNPGDAFTVVSENNGWVGIDFNGRTGYVSGAFVTVSEGQTPQGGAAVPTVDALDFEANYMLRMRAAPSADADQVGVVQYQDVVRAIGRSADNGWILITREGVTGWVSVRYGRLSGNIRSLPVR